MPLITALYAGVLGILSAILAGTTGAMRARKGVPAGDGGDHDLLMLMRRHANFVEYVPLALILIGLLEVNGVRHDAIHYLGLALVLGRLLHAAFFMQGEKSIPRGIGAGLTQLVIVVASIWAIVLFFR